jgi:hypothetical protein
MPVDRHETQHAGIEIQRFGDILDAQHGVVEHVAISGDHRLGGDSGQVEQIGMRHEKRLLHSSTRRIEVMPIHADFNRIVEAT